MNVISVGDRLLPGSYTLHSQFKRAANFENAEGMLFLVTEAIGSGPMNVMVKDLDFASVRTITYGGDWIEIGQLQCHISDALRYDSQIRWVRQQAVDLADRLTVFESCLTEVSSRDSLAFLIDPTRCHYFQTGFEQAFVSHMCDALQLIQQGQCLAGLRKMKGCGVGATPSGDDFIAGFLIGLYVLSIQCDHPVDDLCQAIYRMALGNNRLSNAFLAAAQAGRVMQKTQNFLEALRLGSSQTIQHCTKRLFEMGATSGADWATGFLIAIRQRERFNN